MSPTRTAVVNLTATARTAAEWLLDIAGDPRPPAILARTAEHHALALRHAAEEVAEAVDPTDPTDPARHRAYFAADVDDLLGSPRWGQLRRLLIEDGWQPPVPSAAAVERAEWLAAGVLPVDGLEEPEPEAKLEAAERDANQLAADLHYLREYAIPGLDDETLARWYPTWARRWPHVGAYKAAPLDPMPMPEPVVRVDAADLVTEEHLNEALARTASFAYVRDLEARLETLAADLARYAEAPVTSARRGTALESRARLLEDRLDSLEADFSAEERKRADLEGRVRSLESRLDDLARAVGDRLSTVENITTTVVGHLDSHTERKHLAAEHPTPAQQEDPQRVRLMMDSNAPDLEDRLTALERRGGWRRR